MRDDTQDYEDLYALDDLDDQEMYDLIVQALREYPDFDPDGVEVLVENGFVTLTGRVGVEQELQEVEHILTDVLGITSFSNEIVVDELARAVASEAADEVRDVEDAGEYPLGTDGEQTDPQADHLIEDLAAESYGTHNIEKAISRGEAYEAPERPIQEGVWSEENH